MFDFVDLGFELAFKYLNPVLILSDGVIGQMMEKVELSEQKPRLSDEEIIKRCPWATTGKTPNRERNIITSLNLIPEIQEKHVEKLHQKYLKIQNNEVRFEKIQCDDAEYLLVAYGASARICQKTVDNARDKGIKLGLLRPITLFPFPSTAINEMSKQVKGILTVEMSLGQMVEDVRLAVNGNVKVEHFGRVGGMIPSPDEVLLALKQQIIGG